jgi:pyruvate,orthophosphate dikinase
MSMAAKRAKQAKKKATKKPAARKKPAAKKRTKPKLVYFFGGGSAEGNAGDKELLGGKGANLAEMAGIGLPVPPGFTITTEVCTAYDSARDRYPSGLAAQVAANLSRLEKTMGKQFGNPDNPLLVSVRSGAPASMPGMMDTVLNLGLNDKTVAGLAAAGGDERFAWDSYRRFIQMYGDVVMDLKPQSAKEIDPFEALIEAKKEDLGIKLDTDMTTEDLKDLVAEFKALIRKRCRRAFPTDPNEQLWGAVGAVFRSWDNERAIVYRRLNDIPAHWGTAVNVQAMVFGNRGKDSATGVAFTRNPATGEDKFYGEFLVNAQGEDVVAGIRTPQQITLESSREWAKENNIGERERASEFPSLEEVMPSCYRELRQTADKLERHYRDMQDLEFTIEDGQLFMLQTRNGKRTAKAAVRIATEMVKSRRISRTDAVLRVAPWQVDQLLHPTIDPKSEKELLTRGLGASPGAAGGTIVFSAEDAVEAVQRGQKVLLVRVATSPEDITGMVAAEGILTATGGRTSHAAVVARGMGKCCVVGADELRIDYANERMTVGGLTLKRGDWLTIDGATGEVFLGNVPTVDAELTEDFRTLLTWADKERTLKIRANADTPADSKVAVDFGAEGIGLCRTEHMFFEGNRITAVREMILADDRAGREKALARLLPYQRKDFVGIFKAMEGKPVTVRLLDPPLHEFLPQDEAGYKELARELDVDADHLQEAGAALHEYNPMLGHRGCRLAISFPEIYAMQTRAIIEAALQVAAKGTKVEPEIMIPLVAHARELEILRSVVEEAAEEVFRRKKKKIPYKVGTMIEVPRAALTADEVVRHADFFSFGTNDLTQMAFGLSRDDSGRFLPAYVELDIFEHEPFAQLDTTGVGMLMEIAVAKGRAVRPDLKLGICGEHGGDPSSIAFCHNLGLEYVSCSPYRVPVARLAAAHAALAAKSS